jgi:hypothetical protein
MLMSFSYVNNRILTTNEPFLVLSPSTVKIVGRSAAIVLQQLHYWISSPKKYGVWDEDQRWIYNTYEEWQKQIKIFSTKTIQRAFKTLSDLNLVISKKMNKKASDQTKSYTIDYAKLSELIGVDATEPKKQEDKMAKSSGQNDSILIKNTKRTSKKTSITEEKVENQKFEVSNSKKNIPEEMLLAWNKIIEDNKKNVTITPLRARFLKKAFTDSFECDIDKWKEYCYKIASSKFLMGEVNEFKASLDWCLKFETIHRIKEGSYSQGTRNAAEIGNRNSSVLIDINNNIFQNESVEAFNIRKFIIKKIGNSLYASWFSDARISIKEGRGVVNVKNNFIKDHIKTQFRDLMEELSLEVNHSSDYLSLTESCELKYDTTQKTNLPSTEHIKFSLDEKYTNTKLRNILDESSMFFLGQIRRNKNSINGIKNSKKKIGINNKAFIIKPSKVVESSDSSANLTVESGKIMSKSSVKDTYNISFYECKNHQSTAFPRSIFLT